MITKFEKVYTKDDLTNKNFSERGTVASGDAWGAAPHSGTGRREDP